MKKRESPAGLITRTPVSLRDLLLAYGDVVQRRAVLNGTMPNVMQVLGQFRVLYRPSAGWGLYLRGCATPVALFADNTDAAREVLRDLLTLAEIYNEEKPDDHEKGTAIRGGKHRVTRGVPRAG